MLAFFGARVRYGDKIGDSVELQETQGIAYGMARIVIGWSQAVLLTGVLMLGAGMVFDGQMTGQALTTFIFYTNFVTAASFDVGDQVRRKRKLWRAGGGGDVCNHILHGRRRKTRRGVGGVIG